MSAHSPSNTALLLSSSDVRALLPLRDCIDAVERAFALHAEGKSIAPGVLGVHTDAGGFHIKAAGLRLDRPYFAAKCNANFPGNPTMFGLPTIQGIVLLCDATNGRPLAVIDSMSITSLRTAAATAVAVRHLGRPDATALAVIGCGSQAADQIAAVACVRPIGRIVVTDRDPDRAQNLADAQARLRGIPVTAVAGPGDAARQADIVVTCTTSREPVLRPGDLRPDTLVAAVGADNPEKSEIDPALMAASTVVVDSLDQCAKIGDLHHAIASGSMRREDVHGDLASVILGRRPGRTSPAETIVFDSTGTALQDVAACVVAFQKTTAAGLGSRFDFAR